MSENEEDLAARVKRLEHTVDSLKELVRRLNRKLTHESQPVGLARMRGFEPVMGGESVEQRRIELEEEQELDCEDAFEVELETDAEVEAVEEVTFDFVEGDR